MLGDIVGILVGVKVGNAEGPVVVGNAVGAAVLGEAVGFLELGVIVDGS